MVEANPLILKLAHSGALTREDHRPLAELCKGARVVEAGTVLVRQGDRIDGVHLVLDGFAYRYKVLANGRRQIIGILLPGDFNDLQGSILGASDHSTATLTNCCVVWLPQETVDALTLVNNRIARALWWATLVDQRILRSWLTNMGQLSADVCLAHFCCEHLARLQMVGRAGPDTCDMPLYQEQLGDILGISDVHANRMVRELRARNLLEIRSRVLTVPDVLKLQTFCKFDPSYLRSKPVEIGPSK